MSVMVLQGHNPPLRKADHLSLAIGDMVLGWLLSIAISWGKKMNLNFSANMAGFCRDSHILYTQFFLRLQY